MSQVAHWAKAYPCFCMKGLGIFPLLPEWDASPSQVNPCIKVTATHLYTCMERGTESKVSHPRTQHNVPNQSLSLDLETSSQIIRGR